jgi:hypothetical protein
MHRTPWRVLGPAVVAAIGLLAAAWSAQAQENEAAQMAKQLKDMSAQMRELAGSIGGTDGRCYAMVSDTLTCYANSLLRNSSPEECKIPSCLKELSGIDVDELLKEATRVSEGNRKPLTPAPNYQSTGAAADTSAGGTRQSTQSPAAGSNGGGSPAGPGAKQEQVRTKPSGGIPYEQRWAYADGENYGLKESYNGTWKEGDFVATGWGSDKMFINTYCSATVVNSKGEPSTRGGWLEVSNNSKKYPAYFGLSGVLNQKIAPGQTAKVYLAIYRSKSDTQTTRVSVHLKWWEPGTAPTRK